MVRAGVYPRKAYMDVWQITVAALRRWYILLPLLALTGYVTMAVGDSVRPQYEVTATSILVPGTVESEIASPYGDLESTTGVLTILLDNIESRSDIAALGLDSDYMTEGRSRTSIIDFSVISDTPEVGLATGEAVLGLADQELRERQDAAGIVPQAQIGLQVLQAPSVSDVVTDGKLRNMAIVGMLGAVVSVLVAVLFDDIVGLIRRRFRKRRERPAGMGDPSAAPLQTDTSAGQVSDRRSALDEAGASNVADPPEESEDSAVNADIDFDDSNELARTSRRE